MEVVVKWKPDGRVETYDDVAQVFVNNQNELCIRVWWIGEQTAMAYIPMESIESYSIIDK